MAEEVAFGVLHLFAGVGRGALGFQRAVVEWRGIRGRFVTLRRYLLIARHPGKMPSFVYRPPTFQIRTCGEVLGPLPLPDDPAGGPMHRLPRLRWRTWVRLALIPAGEDWRALERIGRNWYDGAYRIVPWDKPAATITTGASPSCGAVSVADPRLGYVPRKGSFRILRWDEPSTTVIGSASVRGSNGAAAVADPRLGCSCRAGSYGVLAWDAPAKTILGSGDVHAGAVAVADPRIPWDERSDPLPLIVAEDGTWHRPLTTFELAMLQGFPATLPDGRPLQLTGRADSRWRERIGNAVPPPAAQAIAETIIRSLIPATRGACALSGEGIWVAPDYRNPARPCRTLRR